LDWLWAGCSDGRFLGGNSQQIRFINAMIAKTLSSPIQKA